MFILTSDMPLQVTETLEKGVRIYSKITTEIPD